MTHTPGPWHALPPARWAGPDDDWLVPGVAKCGHGEFSEANARLIAAAPELLQELRTSPCPGGGYNGQPEGEEPTVDNCLKAGNCGCTAGAAVKKAIG